MQQGSLLKSLKLSSIIEKFVSKWNESSRQTKIVVLVLTGLSLSVLAAGVILRQRRKRYRGVSPVSHHQLHRLDTFRTSPQPGMSSHHRRASSFPSPLPEILIESDSDVSERGGARRRLSVDFSSVEFESPSVFESISVPQDSEVFLSLSQNNSAGLLSDDFFDATDLVNPYTLPPSPSHMTATSTAVDLSDSDDDSFVSATQSLDHSRHDFYLSSLEIVEQGKISCRTLRTEVLGCTSDKDFLAKLHCIRQAFSDLILSTANRDFISAAARDIIASLLTRAQYDTKQFIEYYNDIIAFCEAEDNWTTIEEELFERGVVCISLYDVALDFLLLDAFDDLSQPPAAMLSVIQNTWISDGIKQSMLGTAIWSILKAKKSMLKNKDGFMTRFYLLGETMTPMLAWGFLGTNDELQQLCQRFKMTLMKFLQSIFSLDTVRYTTVHTLADDIMNHARRAVASLSDI